jgi:hypothetical protein
MKKNALVEMEGTFPFLYISVLTKLEQCTESRFNFTYPGIFPLQPGKANDGTELHYPQPKHRIQEMDKMHHTIQPHTA